MHQRLEDVRSQILNEKLGKVIRTTRELFGLDGHGMKGAMNAAMTDGLLRMAAEKSESLSPANLMHDLNNVLVTRMEEGMNVTMVIALLNTVNQTLHLANAAHHAHPLLVRNGKVEPL